ncbi:MAG: hypothetical protein OEW19_12650 [Acidobacteriota bacterium]|nr:hypothetical protein [Acidobacteriota bacterium]
MPAPRYLDEPAAPALEARAAVIQGIPGVHRGDVRSVTRSLACSNPLSQDSTPDFFPSGVHSGMNVIGAASPSTTASIEDTSA